MLLLVAAVMAAAADAQVFLEHSCQNISAVHDFQVDKYLGLWYEYKKVSVPFEAGGVCITAEYSLKSDNTVIVHNKMVDSSTGSPREIVGSALVDSTTGEGKLKVIFPTEGIFKLLLLALQRTAPSLVGPFVVDGNLAAPYWVLDTDYSGYSLVWSCVNLGSRSIQFAWVLTREKFPEEEVLRDVDLAVKDNGLEDLPLQPTLQTCS